MIRLLATMLGLALGAGGYLSSLVAGIGAAGFTRPADLYSQIEGADWAIVTAYVLPTHGGMTAALETLCRSGRRGDVILAGDQFIVGARVRASVNQVAQSLREAHCHVSRTQRPFHLKLAYVAPGIPYLADRNWGRAASIIRIDDQPDRDLIAQTLRNHPGSNGHLATLKSQALAIEAQSIATTSGPLSIESESFGANNPVYSALLTALGQHRPVSLIVANAELGEGAACGDSGDMESSEAKEERMALAHLQAAGAKIRRGCSNAKMAVGLNGAWIGSTNATAGYTSGSEDQVDWGRSVDNVVMRAELERRFLADWYAATPL